MELKDWLNSINQTKVDLIVENPDTLKEYAPYIINRCLSAHIDCVLFANEMNMNHHISKDMQYYFFLNTIRKRKRYSPWLRKDKIKDLECVKQFCQKSKSTLLNNDLKLAEQNDNSNN
jgi:hypothetical protein